MKYIPNCLTVLRLLLAPCAFFVSGYWRFFLLILIALTDFFDGFLARKFSVQSRFGTIVDPIADKAAAVSFGYVFWAENLFSWQDLCAFFSREISLLVFFLYLLTTRQGSYWKIQSIFSGKIMTFLQCLSVVFLCLYGYIPRIFIFMMWGSGIGSFIELFVRLKKATFVFQDTCL